MTLLIYTFQLLKLVYYYIGVIRNYKNVYFEKAITKLIIKYKTNN